MPLSKCERCNALFNRTAEPVCEDCLPAEHADRARIRDAIDAQPERTAHQLAEACDVDIKVVHRMIEEGDLAHIKVSEKPTCGRCGAPAISMKQRLCEACLNDLNRQLKETSEAVHLANPKPVRVGRGTVDVRRTLDEKRRE